jgi:DNA end-binding protein Ku
MLRPVDGILAMQQLRFASEVAPAREVEVPKTEVKPAELKLARQLIDSQQADMFDPTAYVDEVRGRVEAAIQKKVEGSGDLGVRSTRRKQGQGHRPDGRTARESAKD